jgi:hypothetical protein
MGMAVEVFEEGIPRLVSAIEHYDAYMRSQKRNDSPYRDLADRQQQRIKKPAASATTRQAENSKSR